MATALVDARRAVGGDEDVQASGGQHRRPVLQVIQCCGRGGMTGEPPDDVSVSEGITPPGGTTGYGPIGPCGIWPDCGSGTKPIRVAGIVGWHGMGCSGIVEGGGCTDPGGGIHHLRSRELGRTPPVEEVQLRLHFQ
jgi:hypothetical protein